MEKRILADQGNSLVDLSKVREASECIVPSRFLMVQTSARLQLICSNGFSIQTKKQKTDAEPDVRHAVRGAELQRGAGLTHPHLGEARGGAEGGLQEPDAAPVQHAVHAELLHPPPPQGTGGENRYSYRGR